MLVLKLVAVVPQFFIGMHLEFKLLIYCNGPELFNVSQSQQFRQNYVFYSS